MRLGILGGTFNPIHVGHLILAESAREQYALDQVWFIPTAKPPHKPSRDLLDGELRLRLIRLAIRGHPTFRASDLELSLGGVSYTVRTVRMLRGRVPNARLFLIVGADMLGVKWVGVEELHRLCTVVVADRGQPARAMRLSARGTSRDRSSCRGREGWLPVMRLSMPRVEISSSMIRARIRRGQSIRFLVPDAAARYIVRHNLFRGVNR